MPATPVKTKVLPLTAAVKAPPAAALRVEANDVNTAESDAPAALAVACLSKLMNETLYVASVEKVPVKSMVEICGTVEVKTRVTTLVGITAGVVTV
ncbi:hypothetical protein MCEMAEM4_03384 [Burkholderiaceae bacterium]